MKRTMFLLPIALIALTLTGCAGGKSTPRLDSSGRNERVEAANVASNKYDAPALVALTVNKPVIMSAKDASVIVGCWAMQADNLLCFRIFNANGTCKEAACTVGTGGKLFFIYHAEGIYRLLPARDIELSFHAAPNDRKVQKLKYRLSKNALELKMGDHWREFKRVTQ